MYIKIKEVNSKSQIQKALSGLNLFLLVLFLRMFMIKPVAKKIGNSI